MRSPARVVATVVLSAAVLAAGYAVSPKELPSLDFVTPVGNAPDDRDVTEIEDSEAP